MTISSDVARNLRIAKSITDVGGCCYSEMNEKVEKFLEGPSTRRGSLRVNRLDQSAIRKNGPSPPRRTRTTLRLAQGHSIGAPSKDHEERSDRMVSEAPQGRVEWWPQQELNLHLPLRRGSFYPLNYGATTERSIQYNRCPKSSSSFSPFSCSRSSRGNLCGCPSSCCSFFREP